MLLMRQTVTRAGDYQIEDAKTFGTLTFGGAPPNRQFRRRQTKGGDMDVEIVGKFLSTLPPRRRHPYDRSVRPTDH